MDQGETREAPGTAPSEGGRWDLLVLLAALAAAAAGGAAAWFLFAPRACGIQRLDCGPGQICLTTPCTNLLGMEDPSTLIVWGAVALAAIVAGVMGWLVARGRLDLETPAR